METPQVHLHDSLGVRLGTLTRVTSVNRSWAILQPGQASCRVSLVDDEGRFDPLVRELHPYRGRAVAIESEHYPFPWVGAITNVQEDPAERTAQVTAVSLDAVLRERYLPVGAAYDNDAGQVFRLILQDSNLANDSGISVGGTPAQGRAYAASFPDRSVYGALNALCQHTGHEWGMEYDVRPERIIAAAIFVPELGFDRFESVTLTDGGNCERVQSGIDGRGKVFALHMVAGQTSVLEAYTERARALRQISSGQEPRGGAYIGAAASVHGYEVERSEIGGSPLTRAEALRVAESLRSEGALVAASELLLGRPRAAERVLRLRVFEDDPSTWARLDIGSVVHFVSAEAFLGEGYDGPVRIVGVQPMEESGDLELVCQVLGARA